MTIAVTGEVPVAVMGFSRGTVAAALCQWTDDAGGFHEHAIPVASLQPN
jgi:hypothetical protein